ncbi:type IV secretion system protein [Salmonella enterica subsp. enterica serovar Eko]|jgi:type IV secretion system protein VirB8|uniref:Bacterial virulence protein VirB8 domain-containing protein n=5 Tax=Enterobacteriaceae TaxID=543 RepID=A7MR99_CROS8|nr:MULTISPECIES: type IV secretion system protein [Enterobacterales]EAA0960138.1 type IV secretion system protein [Salmonella enterica subsp. enterica serovar Typhimurium]EAB9051018.1 type IV secretion system protein [Salmonella enterica subsp. enterica serovar Oranienburg]EAC0613657.1 type IV secretion system protein [Salmonella enterica subsp. enterica]EBQ9291838.1 type IV secretion system protein [Salmonella enterica subsp. enterica serovar Ohio]EBW4623561.1 type IV secretion system protein
MSEQKLIAESRSFEQREIERDKRAAKAGFVVGGAGLLIAVLAVAAILVMLPLKETTVELVTVDNHTGRTQHITRASKTSITAEEAYQKAMAANYVKIRERYVYPSLQDDYETVQMYNSPEVNNDYLALYAGKNAPDKVYNNGANTVKIDILSSQITDGTAPDKVATIRYKKTIRRLVDNQTRYEYWDARFTFHSDPNKEMSDEEREVNYFGFTVTSWQTDREIRGGE